MATLEFLRKKLTDIKRRTTRFRNYIGLIQESPDLELLQTKLNAYKQQFECMYQLFDNFDFSDDNAQEVHHQEFEQVEEDYYRVITDANILLKGSRETSPQSSIATTSTIQSPQPIIRNLPEMKLCQFDGSLDDWHTFRSIFISRIDSNENISEVEKFYYLQSCLTGKAAQAIRAIECTENNYREAWNILVRKYDNSRRAILKHWAALQDYPRLQRDTPAALDDLVVTFRQHLRSLKGLGEPVESFSSIIIFMLLNKISDNTRYAWETTLPNNKMPNCETLLEFLERRGNCSEPLNGNKFNRFNSERQYVRNNEHGKAKTFTAKFNKNDLVACPICKQNHAIQKCEVFSSMKYAERRKAVYDRKLCYNCLKFGHGVNDCKSGSCRNCKGRHHTLLHSSPEASAAIPIIDTNIQGPSTNTRNFLIDSSRMEDILPTASLLIKNKDNLSFSCRAIIDTGATRNFITYELAEKLRLKKNQGCTPIGVLNEITTASEYSVTATIRSKHNDFQKTIEFLAVPSITTFVPEIQIDRRSLNLPKNIQLADPLFYKPAPVELLIGAGTSLSALCVGQIRLSPPEQPDLMLQKTYFGWILGGSLPLLSNANGIGRCNMLRLENDIFKFWELEDGPVDKRLSAEETACEDHFNKHVQRSSKGNYIVALPFNEKAVQIGDTFQMALKRLTSLERRFAKNSLLKEQYSNAIQEYIRLGYMRETRIETSKGYFLPHQPVFKETSLTTKVRVVFDGSAPSSSGVSLNDALMCGPTIQDDIFSLLLRFRLHNYVLTGDIEKMYMQVIIREQDQPYLQILWRNEEGLLIKYRFNRLIFGLKPASFLATRCLQQLADEEVSKYPAASKILKRDLYVDDLLTGASTIEELIELKADLMNLLSSGGFNLRQCASNSEQVLQTIPRVNVNLQLQSSESNILKTLGVHWNSALDAIVYTVRPIKNAKITKRNICSEIARIFDPLGLLNPVMVTAKLIMQELWRLGVDWDESLPQEISTKWIKFIEQLPILNNLTFERKMLLNGPQDVQLHGFCDASKKAYGACIYLRSTDASGNIDVHLFCAKSKVAPIKKEQTIPRLELCAAALLADLYITVKKSIQLVINQEFFWTDSTVALSWIRSSPHLLKVFVANRVATIQEKTKVSAWNYISTDDNPADLLSRGQMPNEFANPVFWKQGPVWLRQRQDDWPLHMMNQPRELLEARKPHCLHMKTLDNSIFKRFSCFIRLLRVVAWCLRFSRHREFKKELTSQEINTARIRVLKNTQMYFIEEVKKLQKGKTLSTESKLLSLNPFMDGDGLLRVGGRLQKADNSFDQKHPIILPKSDHVTTLIIRHFHEKTFHGGVQTTLYALRQAFWIVDGRNQVRHVLRSCVVCTRYRPSPVKYIMGNLPEVRTLQARPFTNTGIDYCGPFYVKEKKYRNRGKEKIYVSVFICLSTKAVHLEIVSDLTSEGFIAALKRFIARRGMCCSIYSDNGTTFVGANKELKEILALIKSQKHNQQVQGYLANRGIQWHFSPPQAPHFGGIWEAAVKSFKHHLRRVAGNVLFSFENFNTLVIEIEAILNSRPLTPISSDPTDLLPLTPAHFLIGDSLTSLPELPLDSVPQVRLSTWQHIQKLKQDFWARWHKEYINELNIRSKWLKGSHSMQVGSMVLVRDENLPPLRWRLGRVINVHPGDDGVIRAASIKTAQGEIKRCVRKLVLLPVTSGDKDTCGSE